MTNGLSHYYNLDKSILGASGVIFHFLFHFAMEILYANRISPDGTTRFAASHLWLFCLPMSHKKDARLIWVKKFCLTRGRIQDFRKGGLNLQRKFVLLIVISMQRPGTGAIGTHISLSNPKWEISKIINNQNTKRTPNEQLFLTGGHSAA